MGCEGVSGSEGIRNRSAKIFSDRDVMAGGREGKTDCKWAGCGKSDFFRMGKGAKGNLVTPGD